MDNLFVKHCGTSKIKPEQLELLKLNKSEAIKKLDEGYKKSEFIEFINELKKQWKEINGKYFQKIKELTKTPWQFDLYTCYISLTVPGLSDVFYKQYNKIILSNIYPSKLMKYVLAHQLFHLHYVYFCKKLLMPKKCASTGVVELIPILFMVVNTNLGKLWPDITLERVRNSYRRVNRIIKGLVEYYKSEKDFQKIVEKVIELDRED